MQQLNEEKLKRIAMALAEKERDLMQRELSIAMLQLPNQPQTKPTPKKRKGKFRHKALKKEQIISNPSG